MDNAIHFKVLALIVITAILIFLYTRKNSKMQGHQLIVNVIRITIGLGLLEIIFQGLSSI